MTTYTFEVKQIQIAGKHTHTWEAREVVSQQAAFPLPKGGNGKYIGAYPEIEQYIRENFQKKISVVYRPGLDEFTPDYSNGLYKWCYHRGDDTIIVNDISRVAASFTTDTH